MPIIATGLGGNREVVADGATGVLVPPHDPNALAEAMKSLACHPERAIRMGEEGQRRALSSYSRTSMVSATINVFERLLRDPGR